jgi:hypothetical protein
MLRGKKPLENLEVDKFINTYNPPKLNQDEMQNINRPTIHNETEAVKKSLI